MADRFASTARVSARNGLICGNHSRSRSSGCNKDSSRPCARYFVGPVVRRSREYVVSQLDHAVVEPLLIEQRQVEPLARKEAQPAAYSQRAQEHVDAVDQSVSERFGCQRGPLDGDIAFRVGLDLRYFLGVEAGAQLGARSADRLESGGVDDFVRGLPDPSELRGLR